jgi:hypothetical protein
VDLEQIKRFVIRPALQAIDLWSPEAEVLVLGTGAVESDNYLWIDQVTNNHAQPGPAYGPWQMEEATYRDIWQNFIFHRPELDKKLSRLTIARSGIPLVSELHGNLFLGAAMCRLHYKRVMHHIPAAHDALEMALYWKQHYNTMKGKGTVEKALPYFRRAVQC